jgi:HEAT repeat protein
MRLSTAVAALSLVVMAGCSTKGEDEPRAGGHPLSHWLTALHDRDPAVRHKAATKLGNIGASDPAVVPALIGAVKDPDPKVRSEVILSLLKIGPAAKDSVPALTEALKDPDAKVRQYAEKALVQVQKAG